MRVRVRVAHVWGVWCPPGAFVTAGMDKAVAICRHCHNASQVGEVWGALSDHLSHAVLCAMLCCAAPCCALQDLVIPALKHPGHYDKSPLLLVPPGKRDILLYFKGDMGRHRMPWYSRCGALLLRSDVLRWANVHQSCVACRAANSWCVSPRALH